MAVATVAFRYAKSLIDLAQEKGLTDEIYKDMQLFRQTVADSRPLQLLLQNPVVRNEKKYGVINAVFQGKVHPLSMSFFHIITNKHRAAIITPITEEYIRLYDQLKGVERATVITTTPLTDELREQFKKMVQANVGGNRVELEERVDARLIGGYVLRLGDRQIDASLRNQLNELKTKFLN